MNLDRAFTLEKRAYDKSMQGLLAISTAPTGQVGVVRQLSLDAEVTSARGYIRIPQDNDELKSTNMFSPAELLTAYSATSDDGPRVAMQSTQAKHVVPCKSYSKPLVGNGAEKALAHMISDDFAFKAKQDGKVVERNDSTGIIVLEYKDGSHDFVQINSKISKNGGGGFFIENQLTSNLKTGDKFKQDDIVAVNNKFFDKDEDKDIVYKGGALLKVAMLSSYYTFEDSSKVSTRVADLLSTDIIMKKDIVLGKNSNIEHIVKVGDEVEVGDPLVIFDNSFDDEGLNKMLASLDSGVKQRVKNLGKTPLKSKYSGVVSAINIYYNVEFDELSDSMKKVIKQVNKPIEDMKGTIKKYEKNPDSTNLNFNPTGKIDSPDGKIKSVDVGEGVLIEVFVKYNDRLNIGDKISFYTALKSVICETFPPGLEPYSVFRPDEKIDAITGPIGLLARMTSSILKVGQANKVLIELKHKLKDIYEK